MDDIEDKNSYVVVEFPGNSTGKKDIDLVPSKWITKEDGELFCRYPPSEEYNKLDKYAQELIDACENWEKYAVTILTYADSYSKGKRRLKRAYKTIEIRSTDDDHNQEITMPTVFSKQSINDEFRSVPAMENHPSTSSGKKYSKHKQKEKLDDDEVEAADELAPIIEAHEVFDFG
ncbi:uncharacterized protein LOC141531951 [Cotesia typhae]|uniref:uncharacterized protein LOC141531951 n=1 Tax=Cotesia typhae TaxID=2053667 RepID=UPI003D699A45